MEANEYNGQDQLGVAQTLQLHTTDEADTQQPSTPANEPLTMELPSSTSPTSTAAADESTDMAAVQHPPEPPSPPPVLHSPALDDSAQAASSGLSSAATPVEPEATSTTAASRPSQDDPSAALFSPPPIHAPPSTPLAAASPRLSLPPPALSTEQQAKRQQQLLQQQRVAQETHYALKKVSLPSGLTLALVLQTQNGPCPLIAIVNALILRGDVRISPDYGSVSLNDIILMIVEHMLRIQPKNLSEEQAKNYQQNLSDALSMLHGMQHGLDVNVSFYDIRGFEFTHALNVFDMVNLELVHGWLVDPSDAETAAALERLSYNQCMEKVLAGSILLGQNGEVSGAGGKESVPNSPKELTAADEKVLLESGIIERFLLTSSSQLTYYGLAELHQRLQDNQFCVFFRNNHFSTLHKHDGELFVLLTDVGFRDQPQFMWEKLNEVDGDAQFCTPQFKVYNPEAGSLLPSAVQSSLSAARLFAQDVLSASSDSSSVGSPQPARPVSLSLASAEEVEQEFQLADSLGLSVAELRQQQQIESEIKRSRDLELSQKLAEQLQREEDQAMARAAQVGPQQSTSSSGNVSLPSYSSQPKPRVPKSARDISEADQRRQHEDYRQRQKALYEQNKPGVTATQPHGHAGPPKGKDNCSIM